MESPSVKPATDRVDWEAVEHSAPFQELVHKRRAFVLPATAFFLLWYLAFILLAGYAPDFMGRSVYEGLTVGYMLALTQFAMVWILGLMYLRKADRDFEPLEEAAAAHAMTLAPTAAKTPTTGANGGGPASGAVPASTGEEMR